MKRLMSAAAVVLLAVSGGIGDEKDPQKVRKDTLPRENTVQWDVTMFEDSPSFEVVKREVKGNTITWVLENKRMLSTEITFGYQGTFYDADGVKLGVIEIAVDPFLMNVAKGDRNRFSLHLPQPDKWQGVKKVVIKNGQY